MEQNIMSTLIIAFVIAIPIIAIAVSVFAAFRTMRKTGNAKKALKRHAIMLLASVVICFSCTVAVSASSDTDVADEPQTAVSEQAEAGDTSAEGDYGNAIGMGFIAAALSIGLAGIGAGIALAAGAPAAIGAVSEDPSSFGKSMIFVVLGEALALYGFVIAFLIWLKLPTIA